MVDTALIKQLLESGVHFGHQTKHWNPKMKKYIFGEKNGIYIIDLLKTQEALLKACEFLRKVASEGGFVLFVGTKRQAQSIVKEEADRSGAFYVNNRWLGGLMTNFQTVRKSVKRYNRLEEMKEDGTMAKLSKKEVAQLEKEIVRLKKNLEGVRGMDKLPRAVFVIDSKNEEIAVKEANKLHIPVVGLIDTNSNPDIIDHVIPGNDDAIKSIKFVTSMLADNVLSGRETFAVGEASKKAAEAAPVEPVEEAEEPEAPEEESIEELVAGDIKLLDDPEEKKKPAKRIRKTK
ncbi:MAG: 30S ribosomal protein S2 [Candidatus Omnitrophota bacterium]